jgi:hypothetical protein
MTRSEREAAMKDKPSQERFDAAMDAWGAAIQRRDFKAALKAGIDAYLLGELESNELEAKAALGRIHLAISMIFGEEQTPEPGHPSCSFCGRGGPDVRLGAGPTAYICMSCVGIFHDEAGLRPDK